MKRIELLIGTGGDDLRGGQNNLNVSLLFADHSVQAKENVNGGANWPNKSVHSVVIPLEHPVPVGEIKAIRLLHIANGSVQVSAADATLAAPVKIPEGIKTDDNWDMAYLEAKAGGDGWGARIASERAYRFTGKNSTLVIPAVPPSGCRTGASGGSASGQLLSGGGASGSGELLSSAGENQTGRGQLLGPASSGSTAPSSGTASPTHNPITPSNGANSRPGSGSSSTNSSLQPLIPRDSSNGGSNANSGAASGKPLTNADVVKMVRANLPEQAILASIRANPSEFDVADKARKAFDRECAAIKHPGVSTSAWAAEVKDIWNAMMNVVTCRETNGRGGEDACDLSPLQSSPKNTSGASTPIPSKGNGRTEYEPMTAERGVTHDTGFANWANSTVTNNGSKNADELSPQPYPPKGKAARASGKAQLAPPSKLLKGKLGPAKKGPTIANAAAASRKAATLAMLRTQKQSAETAASQMKTAVRMTGQPGTLQGPSQTMSASGSSGPVQPNGQTAPKAQLGTANSSSSGSAAPRLSQMMGPGESQVLMCAQDPTMRIFQVSGQEGPVTFTTDPTGNFYTITGCSFGNSGPDAKAYIYLGNSFRQEFQVQEWNDSYIKCNLDPSLTGVGDQDSLTLVVQRSDGKQAVKTGFKFYAMRQTRRLTVFPQQYFSLSKFNTQDLSDLQGGVYSPVDPAGYFPNNTAEASWYDRDLQPIPDHGFRTQQNTPPSGTDIYEFSHLALGFEVSSANLSAPDPNAFCSAGGGKLVATTGSFGGQWNGSQLWITWQGWNCNWTGQDCTFWGCTDVFEIPVTDYALDVIVEGPRGVDPWTGQAISH